MILAVSCGSGTLTGTTAFPDDAEWRLTGQARCAQLKGFPNPLFCFPVLSHLFPFWVLVGNAAFPFRPTTPIGGGTKRGDFWWESFMEQGLIKRAIANPPSVHKCPLISALQSPHSRVPFGAWPRTAYARKRSLRRHPAGCKDAHVVRHPCQTLLSCAAVRPGYRAQFFDYPRLAALPASRRPPIHQARPRMT